MDLLPLWIYLAGYAFTYRYVVGAIIHNFAYGEPDGEDVAFGLIMGAMANMFWPALVAARGIYIAWVKWGSERSGSIGRIFPDLKEIETAKDKRQRIEREKEASIKIERAKINARERELEMELTKW